MERRFPELSLTGPDIAAAMGPVLPGAHVLRFEPLRGGRTNTNVRVETDGGPLVLRLYSRGVGIRDKEAALSARLAELPVARCLGSTEAAGAPANVLEFLPGRPLSEDHGRFTDAQWRRAGRGIAAALATLRDTTFEAHGDLAAGPEGLHVQPWPFGTTTTEFLAWSFDNTRASQRLGPARSAALLKAVSRHVQRFPPESTPRLTHGDFGPSNILVGDDGTLTGIVDWEFAHAGTPMMDLGNLFRPRTAQHLPSAFEAALLEALHPPPTWREHAQVIDLTSAVEFLGRQEPQPEAHAAALHQIDTFLRENP